MKLATIVGLLALVLGSGLGTRADTPALAAAAPGRSVPTICIDPGHGGVNSGAQGPDGLLEKDLALKTARKLKFLLEEYLGARVVLTRDGDQDVGLDERTAMANHNNADIFVSIHLNASRSAMASGSETYFLNHEATDSEARAAATQENGILPQEANKGGDGSHELQMLLWDLAQAEYLQDSSQLADSIQNELNGLYGIANRGVKQAPFRVLMGARMPAVLVEVGFISNKDEEKKLSSDNFQSAIASALYRAIGSYLKTYAHRVAPASSGGGPG